MMMVHTGTARSQLGPKASFTLSAPLLGTGIWDPESRCELNPEGVEQKDEKLIRRRFSFLFLPGTELHLHCVMDFVCREGTFLRSCGWVGWNMPVVSRPISWCSQPTILMAHRVQARARKLVFPLLPFFSEKDELRGIIFVSYLWMCFLPRVGGHRPCFCAVEWKLENWLKFCLCGQSYGCLASFS